MQNQQKLETLRESEHNLEKISFFCDVNKSVKKYRDTLVLKTDYPVTLKGRELLMSKDSLFFRQKIVFPKE